MNDILKPFKEYFTMNKNGEYSHLKRTMLTVFHVRFVFVLFETLGFCKSVRVVFPDLTGSKYSLVPTDNSAGNFVKIQQRIPVRIDFTDLSKEDNSSLAAGMMVIVKAKTKNRD